MFDNLDDPRVQAQLAMAFGLLGGRGKGVGATIENIGQAGLLGLNRYALANEDKRRNASADMQNKMLAEQYKQAQRASEYQSNFDTLAKRHFNQGSPATPEMISDDFTGAPYPAQPAQAPKSDFQGFMSGLPGLGGQGVKDAIALQQSMAKDSAFSKIDPKDYTAESIRRFALSTQNGKPDFSILEPVRKREVVDGKVIDPYSVVPGSEVSGPQSGAVPNGRGGYMFNPAKINPVEAANFNLARARAADEGIGGLPGLPGFMTGGVSGPIQRGPSPMPQPGPQSAPTPPVAAPAGIPGLSPKQQREVAFDAAKQGALAEEKNNRGGAAVLDLLKQAEAILPGATGTIPGRGFDYLARAVNQPTSGDKATAQLETISGALLSKMPRMEGPQSNYDVENYKQAAGDLANPIKPVEVRMAALQTLKQLNEKYAPKESKEAAQPEVKQVKIGNKSYDARRGKHGKYYVQMGNTYYEVTE